MDLIIRNATFRNPTLLGRGGEGEVYELDGDNVAKRYYTCDDVRKQKVLALCDFYESFTAKYGTRRIAFPEHPAYETEISFESLVGFSMAKYSWPTIFNLRYDITTSTFRKKAGFAFDDAGAIALVYVLFSILEELHQTRIVLGDINPGNVLWSPSLNVPAIVDIDAAQIGGHACWSWHRDYSDPRIDDRGINADGFFMFDFGSDVFAMACVCFEFLTGVLPHSIIVAPNMLLKDKKKLGMTELRCMTSGDAHLKAHGVSYHNCPQNDRIRQRIKQIKALDEQMYNFFVSVFVAGERQNILYSLPLTDQRHPGFHFFSAKGANSTTARKKWDPAGPSGVPDMGGDKVVSSIVSSRIGAQKPKTRLRRSRRDPPAFSQFLDRLNLGSAI